MGKVIFLWLKDGIDSVIKFFITLYLSVLAGIILVIYCIFLLPDIVVAYADKNDFEEGAYKGTFLILNESIKGLNESDRLKKVEEYQAHFSPLFDLLPISSIDFTKEELNLLNNNRMVIRIDKDETKRNITFNDEPRMSYYKVADLPMVWQIYPDFSISVRGKIKARRMIQGMFYVAEQNLLKTDSAQWSAMVVELEKKQSFPVYLKKLTELSVSEDDLSAIKQYRVRNITSGSNTITFVHRLYNSSDVLVFEMAELPWYYYSLPYFILIVITFIMAMATFLWAWPLWRNLSQLKIAAERFGSGQYNTRYPYSKHSRLAKVSEAFNAMAEQTQRSINSHRELTSAVSHELRTPVARMQFSLEMLSASDVKQERERYISDINKDIADLDSLLHELLTYARFDQNSSRMNFESKNLQEWITSGMQRLQTLSGKKQLDFRVIGIGQYEETLLEPRLMTRVLDNLVQNAIRYAKSTIHVTLGKDHDNYVLVVEDDGAGIAEQDYEKLFDAFSRIDSSRDRRSGGFGLGLAIVKRIVEGHQGTIKISKSELDGAKFEVRWRLHAS